MPKRKSEFSRNRKSKTGRLLKFDPSLEEWSQACKMFPLDKQIIKYFSISTETFYAFIDRERVKEETTGESSAFIEALHTNRKETKREIQDAFMNKIREKDTGSILFGLKVFNGLLEQRDVEHIELKRQQLALKSNEFLTKMAETFSLNAAQLKEFADKYFKDMSMENI